MIDLKPVRDYSCSGRLFGRLQRSYSPAFPTTTMDDYGVDLLEEAVGSSAAPPSKSVSSPPFAKKDVPSLARYIESDACRQIYLMVIRPRNIY